MPGLRRLRLPHLLLLAAAAPASAQSRDRATVLMPEHPAMREYFEQAGFSEAVVIDGTAYLSGVVVRFEYDDETLETAYVRAYDRLGTILKRAGASWADVVDVTSFHTDLTSQMPVMSAVHTRYLTAPFPTWTAVGVTRLIPDRGVTEIKLVARLPELR